MGDPMKYTNHYYDTKFKTYNWTVNWHDWFGENDLWKKFIDAGVLNMYTRGDELPGWNWLIIDSLASQLKIGGANDLWRPFIHAGMLNMYTRSDELPCWLIIDSLILKLKISGDNDGENV